jgi:RNA polymerase sigma factor (sigma-70 family)
LVLSSERRTKARRAYTPAVEALEALRLLDRGAAPFLPGLAAEHGPTIASIAPPSPAPPLDAWDAALGQTRLADLLAPAPARVEVDPEAARAGLDQLDRYLARAWFRAGIPAQKHDDCTQAVYVSLLQNLGRDGFDRLARDVGDQGIRDVLSRETSEGPDFFRAIDTVKKRALREKSFQALDTTEIPGALDSEADHWRSALQEAIARSLNPREADLVRETLLGKTPAEIAAQWGVAPKTVSNEKTRAIQKLREVLVADLVD